MCIKKMNSSHVYSTPRIVRFMYNIGRRHLAKWKRRQSRRIPLSSGDEKLKNIFLCDSKPEKDRYSQLFSYIISGFLHNRSSDLSHVDYPGAPSVNVASIDAMEGFCRILPLIGAWVSSGRDSIVQGDDGKSVDLIEIAAAGLLSGTDPASKGFWGNIGDYDQRIVEAADVALSVWLLRDHMWANLSETDRERIVSWLKQVNEKKIVDNNWHLFPVLVNEVVHSLGYSNNHATARWHYERLKTFYRGNGWFSDGPVGTYDFYNAWGIHYSLFWLGLINPDFDTDFIDTSLNKFVRNYKYLFSTRGIPITGRSICYRMAAPVPLVAAAYKELDGVSAGMARRALDCVWEYFISKGALSCGRVTQGYWHDDMRLLDNYSGSGSCMWSLRSLILAFYCPENSDFWTSPLEKLPIEQDDYLISIPEIKWEIRGYQRTGEVQIVKLANAGNALSKIKKHTLLNRFKEMVFGRPFRPGNSYVKNDLRIYSSLHPFWDDLNH